MAGPCADRACTPAAPAATVFANSAALPDAEVSVEMPWPLADSAETPDPVSEAKPRTPSPPVPWP